MKGLVKECLVEILAEGLSTTGKPQVSVAQKKPQHLPRRRAPDLVSMNHSEPKQNKSSAIEQKIKNVSGGNTIMENILRDTAQNTLPNMIAAESRSTAGMVNRTTRGDTATKAMAQADPMSIFEGASNWAALAFSDTVKK